MIASGGSRTRRGPGSLARSVALSSLLVVAPATGQSDEETRALGKPAAWSMAGEAAEALIPIGPNSALYDEADGGEADGEADGAGRKLAVVPEGRYPLIESRHPWVKIRYGELVGWVDLEAPPQPLEDPSEGRTDAAAEEPSQLEPAPPRDWETQVELGPYTLRSEIADPELIQVLRQVAEQHAGLYRDRFGSSVEASGGQIVVFAERPSFERYLEASGAGATTVHGNGTFHSPRTVALVRGDLKPSALAAALAHELTHFLSWRLRRMAGGGTELPWWLEEGMAEDLALARLDRSGRLRLGPLGRHSLRYGKAVDRILIEAERRLFHGVSPRLSDVQAWDSTTCCTGGADAGFNVLLSALWIRYLLDSERAEEFRVYLGQWLSGGRPGPLAAALGVEEAGIQSDFRLWVQDQRQRLRPGAILPP